MCEQRLQNVHLLYVHSEDYEGPCTKHLCFECPSNTPGAEGGVNQTCFKAELLRCVIREHNRKQEYELCRTWRPPIILAFLLAVVPDYTTGTS